MPTRRQYLASAAAAVASTLAIGTASADDNPDTSHIDTRTGDRHVIEDYQPSLIASYDARTSMVGTYGWRAQSDDYDVDAYYYWIKYPTQDGWFGGAWGDSHWQDHEPIIVFANPDGTVESVVYSGGHHYVSSVGGDNAALVEDKVSGTPTHPKLRIVDPWHHYQHADSTDRSGVLPETISGTEFASWLSVRGAWYDNDVYSKTSHKAVEDPFAMRTRDHWWDSDSIWAGFGKHVWPYLNPTEYESRDDLRIED